MRVDTFMYSEWFGNDIYISKNGNIYCLYPFENGVKTLIMDEDTKMEKYWNFIKGIEEPDETWEVMVYWMFTDMNTEEETYKSVREIVAEYEADSEEFFKKYNTKNRNQIGGTVMKEEKKEIRTVSPAEFITKWNEMKKYWIENDGDTDENSYYNKIINQEIYIELPLLGIKANFGWCPPTVEELDKMFERMIEDEYFDYLVEKESCFYTGGGIWLSEVPFVYRNESLVMVVDNEDSEVWTVYKNVLKDNGSYDSVEHGELMVKSANAREIEPDWQIYYIKALQMLANRTE